MVVNPARPIPLLLSSLYELTEAGPAPGYYLRVADRLLAEVSLLNADPVLDPINVPISSF